MRTSKPLSPVSYNTEEFLRKANETAGWTHWAYIKHKAEMNEKDHIHCYFEHDTEISHDSVVVKDLYNEPDPANDKPRKTLFIVRNKWQTCSDLKEMIFYWLHDERYLQMKGMSRMYHYSFEDIVFSDEEIKEDFRRIYEEGYKKVTTDSIVLSFLCEGYTAREVVEMGFPAPLVYTCCKIIKETNMTIEEKIQESAEVKRLRKLNRELTAYIQERLEEPHFEEIGEQEELPF